MGAVSTVDVNLPNAGPCVIERKISAIKLNEDDPQPDISVNLTYTSVGIKGIDSPSFFVSTRAVTATLVRWPHPI